MAAGVADFLKKRDQFQKHGFRWRAAHVALQGRQQRRARAIERPLKVTKRLPPRGQTKAQAPFASAHSLRRKERPNVGGMIHGVAG